MKLKYNTNLLFDSLQREDLRKLKALCNKLNLKIYLYSNVIKITSRTSKHKISIIQEEDNYYWFINSTKTSKFEYDFESNEQLKELLYKIKEMN